MNKYEQELYTSPFLTVVGIKENNMLCESPGETEKYSSDLDGDEDLNF